MFQQLLLYLLTSHGGNSNGHLYTCLTGKRGFEESKFVQFLLITTFVFYRKFKASAKNLTKTPLNARAEFSARFDDFIGLASCRERYRDYLPEQFKRRLCYDVGWQKLYC